MARDGLVMHDQIIDEHEQAQAARHVEFVQVAFPPVRGTWNERHRGNGRQQQGEGQDHPRRRANRGHRAGVLQVVQRLLRHGGNRCAGPLRPAGHEGRQVTRQDE